MNMTLDRASEVIKVANLADIQLQSAAFSRNIRSPEDITGNEELEISSAFKAQASEIEDQEFFVLTTLEVEVSPQDTDGDQVGKVKDEQLRASDDRAFWVHCTFELKYALPEGFSASSDELAAFAETNGVFNAWPYFREFLQSSMARMGLPPLYLPLFRVARGDDSSEEMQNGEAH